MVWMSDHEFRCSCARSPTLQLVIGQGQANRVQTKGVTRGERGLRFPGRRIAMGAPNDCEGAEKSQQCHKYFLQHSVFASEWPQVRTWGHQTCFLPRAPSNFVTPLVQTQAYVPYQHGELDIAVRTAGYPLCFVSQLAIPSATPILTICLLHNDILRISTHLLAVAPYVPHVIVKTGIQWAWNVVSDLPSVLIQTRRHVISDGVLVSAQRWNAVLRWRSRLVVSNDFFNVGWYRWNWRFCVTI